MCKRKATLATLFSAVLLFSSSTVIAGSSDNNKTAKPSEKQADTCSKEVVTKSDGAVGNPCQTTQEFVNSLELEQKQLAKWEYLREHQEYFSLGE